MNRVRQLRREANMTQEELANLLNVKRSVVSKYENGTVPLTDALILKFSEIFNVTTDYILGKDVCLKLPDFEDFKDLTLNEIELLSSISYVLKKQRNKDK